MTDHEAAAKRLLPCIEGYNLCGSGTKCYACEHRPAVAAALAEAKGDAATLRGYINTHGETPSMTWSRAENLKSKLAEAEVRLTQRQKIHRDDVKELRAERDADYERGLQKAKEIIKRELSINLGAEMASLIQAEIAKAGKP